MRRARHASRPLFGGFAIGIFGLLLSACSSGPSKSATSTTVPAAPTVVGVLANAGAGSAIGTGASAVGFDPVSGTLGRSQKTGTFPDAVAISPTAPMAYVTNYLSNTVTPIDLSTGRAEKSIPAGSGPAAIAITPNGKYAYITDAGTSPIGDTVTPIDLKTKKALAPITVGAGPQGIAISPNGTIAYVADAGALVTSYQSGSIGDSVTPIDLKTNKALASIKVGNGPLALAFSSDGSTVFVTNSYSGSVSPITVATKTAGTPIEVTGSPQAIAAAPNGSTVYVADAPSASSTGSNVTPISISTLTAGTALSVPSGPTSLALTPDGTVLWVVCNGANKLARVDLGGPTLKLAATVADPSGPYALGIGSEPHGTYKLQNPTASSATSNKTKSTTTTSHS